MDVIKCDACDGFGCRWCSNKGWVTPKELSRGWDLANKRIKKYRRQKGGQRNG